MGSHLVDKLLRDGHEVSLIQGELMVWRSHDYHVTHLLNAQVTVADNFFTGRRKNVEHWWVCLCVFVNLIGEQDRSQVWKFAVCCSIGSNVFELGDILHRHQISRVSYSVLARVPQARVQYRVTDERYFSIAM